MNICIGRYDPLQHPEVADRAEPTWEGWVEPEDRSWIIFFATDGTPTVWLHRDENGGVTGDPVTR